MSDISLHKAVDAFGELTNKNKKFTLYYDETNNPRIFKIKGSEFNANEHEYFILGGIGFEPNQVASNRSLDELFSNFQLQNNNEEIKFRHIKQKAKDFLELLTKTKVMVLIDWLYQNKFIIHYCYMDNFYYGTVDIIDSIRDPLLLNTDINFNRYLKNRLYNFIKNDVDWFLNLMIESNYPNINHNELFVRKIIDKLNEINLNKDITLIYLYYILNECKEKELIFLTDNQEGMLVEGYETLYQVRIITYENAIHIFDHELKIEDSLRILNIKSSKNKPIKYEFVDSKDERLVQISDLIVGILKYWMMFLESKSINELYKSFNETSEVQRKYLRLLQKIMLHSINISNGFKYGVGCDDFEYKINEFLCFEF